MRGFETLQQCSLWPATRQIFAEVIIEWIRQRMAGHSVDNFGFRDQPLRHSLLNGNASDGLKTGSWEFQKTQSLIVCPVIIPLGGVRNVLEDVEAVDQHQIMFVAFAVSGLCSKDLGTSNIPYTLCSWFHVLSGAGIPKSIKIYSCARISTSEGNPHTAASLERNAVRIDDMPITPHISMGRSENLNCIARSVLKPDSDTLLTTFWFLAYVH